MPVFLDYFFATQTKKPDIFYIWLSTEEFPDHNLPIKLVNAIQKYNIILKWVDKNEYCHKRWKVYPEHYEDVVISLDEDIRYTNDLIEQSVNCKNITNLCIPRLDKKYKPYISGFCGQCIIPPKTFPLEAYDEKYLNDRLEFSPKCDECWLNVFILKNDINIVNDISLLPPEYMNYDCSSNDTALFKIFNSDTQNNTKNIIFENLVNHMNSKYHFNIDDSKIEAIANYIDLCSPKLT
jgi:hypothetical protein